MKRIILSSIIVVLAICSIFFLKYTKNNKDIKKYELFTPVCGNMQVDIIGEGIVVPRDLDNYEYNYLDFQMEVDETDIPKIAENMEAIITLNAFEGSKLKGHIKDIAMEGDVTNDISTFKVILSIDEEIEKLRAGMTGYACITTEKRENVLYVPIEAIYSEENDKYIIIQSGDIYEKVQVETGISNEDYIEIKSGLTEENNVQLQIAVDDDYVNKFIPKIFRS